MRVNLGRKLVVATSAALSLSATPADAQVTSTNPFCLKIGHQFHAQTLPSIKFLGENRFAPAMPRFVPAEITWLKGPSFNGGTVDDFIADSSRIAALDAEAKAAVQKEYSHTGSLSQSKKLLSKFLAESGCNPDLANSYTTRDIVSPRTPLAWSAYALGNPNNQDFANFATSTRDTLLDKKAFSFGNVGSELDRYAINDELPAVNQANERWKYAGTSSRCAQMLESAEAICEGRITPDHVFTKLQDRARDPYAMVDVVVEVPIIGILIELGKQAYEVWRDRGNDRKAREAEARQLKQERENIETKKIEIDIQILEKERKRDNEIKDYLKGKGVKDVEKVAIINIWESWEKEIKLAKEEKKLLEKHLEAKEQRLQEIAPVPVRPLKITPDKPEAFERFLNNEWKDALGLIEKEADRCLGKTDQERKVTTPIREALRSPNEGTCNLNTLQAKLRKYNDPMDWKLESVLDARMDRERRMNENWPICRNGIFAECRRAIDLHLKRHGYEDGINEYCAMREDPICVKFSYYEMLGAGPNVPDRLDYNEYVRRLREKSMEIPSDGAQVRPPSALPHQGPDRTPRNIRPPN